MIWDSLTPQKFHDFIVSLRPSWAKVAEKLHLCESSPRKAEIFGCLQEIVTFLPREDWKIFLFVFTSSTALPKQIRISFFSATWVKTQQPKAHTCGGQMELALKYENCAELRTIILAVIRDQESYVMSAVSCHIVFPDDEACVAIPHSEIGPFKQITITKNCGLRPRTQSKGHRLLQKMCLLSTRLPAEH